MTDETKQIPCHALPCPAMLSDVLRRHVSQLRCVLHQQKTWQTTYNWRWCENRSKIVIYNVWAYMVLHLVSAGWHCNIHIRHRLPNFSCPEDRNFTFIPKLSKCLPNYTESWGWDSVFSTATGYGLDDPGIESPVAARFSSPVKTQPPIQWVPGPSWG